MGLDAMKVTYTYAIATIIVVGGLLILYLSRNDPPGSADSLNLVISGFIGIALQFVFQRETQTSTARQVERATAAGAASQPTVTTNDASTTTVEPTVSAPQP